MPRARLFTLLALFVTALPALAQFPFAVRSARFEAGATYDLLKTRSVGSCCFTISGPGGAFAYALTNHLALLGEASRLGASHIPGGPDDLKLTTLLGGVRVSRHFQKLTPFAAAKFGLAHASSSSLIGNGSSIAYGAGIGADLWVTNLLSVRTQVDYLRSQLPNGVGDRQNSLRFSTGVVFTFGTAR